MMRIHCVQLFYDLADPALEEMLYETGSVRRFTGLKLSGPIPDETTILNFGHMLEAHKLGQKLFAEINKLLQEQGLMLREGTIVDASIIAAPKSTKNKKGKRDPKMHQTKKGNEWGFGMKMHIGADAELGLVHSLTTTSANVHDITEADKFLHGDESDVWGDAGYQGVHKRKENGGRKTEDGRRKVTWHVFVRPGKRRPLQPESIEAVKEKSKARIRAGLDIHFDM